MIMVSMQRIVHGALNVFSSPKCGLCDRPTHAILCPDCQTQVLSCQYAHPQQFWHPPLPVFAWGRYSGMLKQGIAALKYNNRPDIAELFGQWLGEAWLQSASAKGAVCRGRNAAGPLVASLNGPLSDPLVRQMGGQRRGQSPPHPPLVVIPVPANAAKKKRRGFNQAELIAQAFCRMTRLPLDVHRVIRIEDTVPMHGLSRQDRQRNVQGKFRIHPRFERQLERQKNRGPKGTSSKKAPAVLLLDDIHTSGATLNAIAHLLRQHQMSVYGAVTVAKAEL